MSERTRVPRLGVLVTLTLTLTLLTCSPQSYAATSAGTAYKRFAALARHGLSVPFAASYVLSYGDGDAPLRFKVWSEPEIPNKTQGDFVYQTAATPRHLPLRPHARYRLRVRASDGQGQVEVRRSLRARLQRPNHAGRVLPTPDVRRGTDRQRRLRPAAQTLLPGCARTTIVVPEPRRWGRLVPSSQRPVRLQPRPTGERPEQSNGGGVPIAVVLKANIRPARKAAAAEGKVDLRPSVTAPSTARRRGQNRRTRCEGSLS